MHIQLLSDLHLEVERPAAGQEANGGGDLYKFDFPARADYLALLGDIGTTVEDRLFAWIRIQLERFEIVFYVAGNHEPHWSTLDASYACLEAFAAACAKDAASTSGDGPSLGRFVLLNRTRYDLSPNVTVLGCTLWARLDPDKLDVLESSLNDFRCIRGFDAAAYQAAHERDAPWLEQAVTDIARNEPHRRVVIMDHTMRRRSGTADPKYEGGPTTSAFATEMVGGAVWMAKVVRVWMFGHTHWCCDFVREGVRAVSNQRGYKDGARGFTPEKVVEL
ncbi:hypothetical protein BN946_scf184608.g3 [Trametes cinnabarina]|uniref:Uncharacterized protein n=1 Tax=Pycnoporus cinnabarinus TaxID=5643 RepID=A0A060T092_PYCCI|nr:hypothetical protein BN946_scf184608.g3 [Trametes cinnabarina]